MALAKGNYGTMKRLLTAALMASAFAMPSKAQEIDNCVAEQSHNVPARISVTCDITNTLDTAIAEIQVEIVSKSQNRTVPWTETVSRIGVPGGIEPNETINQLVAVEVLPQRAISRFNEIVWSITAIEAWNVIGLPIMNPLPEITFANQQVIAAAVKPCFNVGVLSQSAQGESIIIDFEIDAFGRPDIFSITVRSSEMSVGQTQLFEAARRAILRCGSNGLGISGPSSIALSFAPSGVEVSQ